MLCSSRVHLPLKHKKNMSWLTAGATHHQDSSPPSLFSPPSSPQSPLPKPFAIIVIIACINPPLPLPLPFPSFPSLPPSLPPSFPPSFPLSFPLLQPSSPPQLPILNQSSHPPLPPIHSLFFFHIGEDSCGIFLSFKCTS